MQHIEYIPFGETLIEEHTNTWQSPYKFSAKEQDSETSLYYFGARYYNPKVSIWYSTDQKMEKYPAYSPYNYTLLNPIKYKDPTGMAPEGLDDWFWDEKNQKAVWHESSSPTIYVGSNKLYNIGATTEEALNSIGALSGRTRVLDYDINIGWEEGNKYYSGGQEKSTKGIPIPQGEIYGVANIHTNSYPVLKIGEDGYTYFSEIKTNINVLYSYNTEKGNDPGMVWSTIKTPKSFYNLSLDLSPSITQGEGKGYVNYLFKTLSIEYPIEAYRNSMELKISTGFTDVNTKGSRVDASVKFSRGGAIRMNIQH
jgi:RHS repeat-associated protein